MYMPGVSDAGVSEPGPLPQAKAELIKLWLPSHLDAAERDSLCSGAVITSERELRFGQLDDALNDLRKARRIRRGLVTFHKVQLAGEGQKTQTKSWAVMHTIQERIDRSVRRYRVARNALLQLDPSGSWQDLYRTLDNCDNRGPGKEPEEAVTSDGRYVPSWIWLSNPNAAAGEPAQSAISPDEVNEDMRVEWAQCVARADRWEEEVILLQEEMRRVVHFLEWKSTDWVAKVDARAGAVTPELRLGLSAYAHKQASIFHNLAIQFCQRWHSVLVSLSLSHAWATDFLAIQGASLVNADSKLVNHKRGPSNTPLTPLRVESSATNPPAAPPVSTDPNTDNNEEPPSSDESDVNSSEFDESEDESSSWCE